MRISKKKEAELKDFKRGKDMITKLKDFSEEYNMISYLKQAKFTKDEIESCLMYKDIKPNEIKIKITKPEELKGLSNEGGVQSRLNYSVDTSFDKLFVTKMFETVEKDIQTSLQSAGWNYWDVIKFFMKEKKLSYRKRFTGLAIKDKVITVMHFGVLTTISRNDGVEFCFQTDGLICKFKKPEGYIGYEDTVALKFDYFKSLLTGLKPMIVD